MAYAAKTEVSAPQSEMQIRTLLAKYQARNFLAGECDDGKGGTQILIRFEMKDRRVQFLVPLPSPDDPQFIYNRYNQRRPDKARTKDFDQATRAAWRAALAVIKAKLIAVDAGIVAFDQEFLSNFVTDTGMTVFEVMRPAMGNMSISKLPALMEGSR